MLLVASTLSEQGASWALGNAPFYLAVQADVEAGTLMIYGMDCHSTPRPEGVVLGYRIEELPPVGEAPRALTLMPRSSELTPWRIALWGWLVDAYGEHRYVTQQGLHGYLEAASRWLMMELLGTTMPDGLWEEYSHLHTSEGCYLDADAGIDAP